MKVAALVLAGGFARRFGSDKRVLPVDDEQTLLQYTVTKYRDAFDLCVVVLREGDAVPVQWQNTSDEFHIVWQQNASAGMGDNLALGVQYLQTLPVDAIAVALADMPLVAKESLAALKQQVSRNSIIVPCVAEQRGHPVVFGQHFFAALAGLSGDNGARSVLAQQSAYVRTLQFDDVGLIEDVDTPADWIRVKTRLL